MSDAPADEGRILISKAANHLIDRAEFGLSELRIVPLAPSVEPAMRAVGMAGREGLGGRLTITTRALVFRTHAANRVRGTLEVPIGEIAAARDVSRGISRRLEVTLVSGHRLLFIVWGGARIIAAIDEARAEAGRG
ncbi:hypothetical protein ITJ42_10390 [Clavibacter michiganensis subsp. phaseoli]|jgi:hypothetical protein|uniref:GRAM domain-containing protein n=1 Tax=Clavibacter phaseoli TaxID=1734031 RepID=A0A8I0VCM2_9MICO|nr:hypothetical protein [Clavibacter phaseoli]MBF4631622.1 hypothetical protein [Clavibacter phaseoli]